MKGIAIVAQRQDEFGQTSTSRFILRVLIFGSLLIALNCYWIISAENRVVWELTDFSVFPTVLFTLFALAGVNLLLKRSFKNLALRNSEVATSSYRSERIPNLHPIAFSVTIDDIISADISSPSIYRIALF